MSYGLKNSRLVGLLLCFLVLFNSCDFIYGMLDKAGAQEKQRLGELIPNTYNKTVEEIQGLLKFQGFNPGKVDGKLGIQTRNAIEAFQKANGLESNRFVDDPTWKMLNRFQTAGLEKSGKLVYARVQEALKLAGFDPGPIDGKAGHRTHAAILQFQGAQNLKKDGKIGIQTLSKLINYLPQQETTPAP